MVARILQRLNCASKSKRSDEEIRTREKIDGKRRTSKRGSETATVVSNDSSSTSAAGAEGRSTRNGVAPEGGFLLDRLGGKRVLDSLVDDFLERVGSDEQLVGFFEGANMAALALHQKRFMSIAFTKIPEGMNVATSIKNHHSHLFALGLNENHFDLVAQHWVAALQDGGVDESIINEAVGIVAPLRAVFEEGATEAQGQGHKAMFV